MNKKASAKLFFLLSILILISFAIFVSSDSGITNIHTEPPYPNLDKIVKIYAEIPDTGNVKYTTLYYTIGDSKIESKIFSGPFIDGAAYIGNNDPKDNVPVEYYLKATYRDDSFVESDWQDFRYDGSAPSTSIIFKGPQYNWFVTSNSKIELSCTDSISGCKEIIYNGNSVFMPYEFSLTGDDGEKEIKYYSIDRAGNIESEETRKLILDNTAPEVEDDYQYKNRWINETKEVTIKAEDSGSGIEEITYCIDGTCTTINDDEAVFKLEDPAIMKIKYWAIDNLGQKSKEINFDAMIDLIAPGVWDDVPLEWKNFDFDITFTDTTSVLSPVTIYYKLWKTTETEPLDYLTTTEKISITQDGEYKLKYYARDEAGNIGPKQDARSTAKLDKTKPIIIDDYLKDGIWTKENAIITLTANDALSGLKEVRYCTGIGCEPISKSAPYTLNFVGSLNEVVRYTAEDNAGNSADIQEIKIMIDQDIPVTSDDYGFNRVWTNNDALIKLTASQDGKSPIHTYYKINDGAFVERNTISITQSGIYNVVYYSQDEAGNKEDEKIIEVKIDKTKPIASITGVPLVWQKESAEIKASCSDAGEQSHCDVSKKAIKVYNTKPEECSQNYNEYNIVGNSGTEISSHKWACSAAVDNAGNTGFSNVYEIFVDQINPELNIITPSENEKIDEMAYYTIKAKASDSTSEIKDVKLILSKNGENILENQGMILGTTSYEHLLLLWTFEAGEYILTITATDNAGNSITEIRNFRIEESAAPKKIVAVNNQIPVDIGGTISFDFDIVLRGSIENKIKFGIEDIAGLTPISLNARISNGTSEVKVGDKDFNGAEWLTLEDLNSSIPNVQGKFRLLLDIPKDMTPGKYPINYYIAIDA